MSTRKDEREYDVRLIRHRISAGTLSREDYAKWIDALPDDAAECEDTDTRFVSSATEAADQA
jgi:hypothetical protein